MQTDDMDDFFKSIPTHEEFSEQMDKLFPDSNKKMEELFGSYKWDNDVIKELEEQGLIYVVPSKGKRICARHGCVIKLRKSQKKYCSVECANKDIGFHRKQYIQRCYLCGKTKAIPKGRKFCDIRCSNIYKYQNAK